MSNERLSNAMTTDMSNDVKNYSVSPGEDTGEYMDFYTPNWTKYRGYLKISEVKSTIDKKAIWTIGNGYKTNKQTQKILENMRGNGKETFTGIMKKAVETYTIAGDYFAEIIKKNGKLHNLKTLNPGRVRIVTDKFGFIKKYEYLDREAKKAMTSWKPEEILHLAWNVEGDNTHGTSTIDKLSDSENGRGIIEMFNEAKQDLSVVFHRYVKPLLISSVDEDDEEEIKKYKQKLDRAVNLGENMVIPKDTVESIERVSIPQYSTLDPLPWIRHLEKEFVKAEGIPDIIQGVGTDTTEATAKILYLAFEQMVKWNQLFLEEQIKAQLNLEIKFEFPVDLAEPLQEDEKKDSKPLANKKSEVSS